MDAFAELRLGTHMRERSNRHARRQASAIDHAMVLHRHAIGEHGVDDSHTRVDFTGLADLRLPFEVDVGMDHGVRAHDHAFVDVSGGRILDRDARGHQFFVLFLSHDAARFCQFRPAVDSAGLVGIAEHDGLDAQSAATIGRNQVR